MKKLIKSEIQVIAERISTQMVDDAKKSNLTLFKSKAFKKVMKDFWEKDPAVQAMKHIKPADVEFIAKLLGAEESGSTSYGRANSAMVQQILNTKYKEPVNIETNGDNFSSYHFVSAYDSDFRDQFNNLLKSLGFIDYKSYQGSHFIKKVEDDLILSQIDCPDLDTLIENVKKLNS